MFSVQYLRIELNWIELNLATFIVFFEFLLLEMAFWNKFIIRITKLVHLDKSTDW